MLDGYSNVGYGMDGSHMSPRNMGMDVGSSVCGVFGFSMTVVLGESIGDSTSSGNNESPLVKGVIAFALPVPNFFSALAFLVLIKLSI
jgi:hypothetical protein